MTRAPEFLTHPTKKVEFEVVHHQTTTLDLDLISQTTEPLTDFVYQSSEPDTTLVTHVTAEEEIGWPTTDVPSSLEPKTPTMEPIDLEIKPATKLTLEIVSFKTTVLPSDGDQPITEEVTPGFVTVYGTELPEDGHLHVGGQLWKFGLIVGLSVLVVLLIIFALIFCIVHQRRKVKKCYQNKPHIVGLLRAEQGNNANNSTVCNGGRIELKNYKLLVNGDTAAEC